MRKHLTAIGGSLGFIIDKPIADLYALDRNTQIEITPKEDGLSIRFIREPKVSDAEVDTAFESVNKKYGKALKNLAK